MDRYETFKTELKRKLEQWFGAKCRIEFTTVMKNNGVVRDSILIQQWGEEQEITLSLSPYWQLFQNGKGMRNVFTEFIEEYEGENISLPFTAAQLLDFAQMKEQVVCRLINADLNRDLLAQIPHILFLDLAIVFALQLWSGENGQLNCLINNRHLELWGVTPEVLYPLSAENTPRLLPQRFRHICDVIGLIEPEAGAIIQEPKLYVLTNQYEVYGAAALLYPCVLKEAADKLESDLLILPSSVHEVLVVPKSDILGKLDFEEVVREINETEVNPEDILSYRIYQYDRKKERVTFFCENGKSGGAGNGSGTKHQ